MSLPRYGTRWSTLLRNIKLDTNKKRLYQYLAHCWTKIEVGGITTKRLHYIQPIFLILNLGEF